MARSSIAASVACIIVLAAPGTQQRRPDHSDRSPGGTRIPRGGHRLGILLLRPDAELHRATLLSPAQVARVSGSGRSLHDTLAGLATTIIAPFSGRLANRVKTAWSARQAAHRWVSASLWQLSAFCLIREASAFLVGTVIAGLGFGLFQTPNNRIQLLSAPKSRSGAAGAMQAPARLLGQTLGGIFHVAHLRDIAALRRAPICGRPVGWLRGSCQPGQPGRATNWRDNLERAVDEHLLARGRAFLRSWSDRSRRTPDLCRCSIPDNQPSSGRHPSSRRAGRRRSASETRQRQGASTVTRPKRAA